MFDASEVFVLDAIHLPNCAASSISGTHTQERVLCRIVGKDQVLALQQAGSRSCPARL